MPRRSGHLRVDEVESRGWGRRAPQSPSSSSFGAPQGNNKIYKCDVVFLSGEARINNKSQTQLPYNKAKDISRLQGKSRGNQIPPTYPMARAEFPPMRIDAAGTGIPFLPTYRLEVFCRSHPVSTQAVLTPSAVLPRTR